MGRQVDVFTSFGDITTAVTSAGTDSRYNLATLDLKSFYSNVVYTMGKTSMATSTNIQNVDCETQSSNTGEDNVYQCIEKGDYVMIFDLELTATSKNPMYPNMYQVMKISRENREAVPDVQTMDQTVDLTVDVYGHTPNNAHFEKLRYQIVLDYGMNARYNLASVGATNKARIYKFTPPTTAVTWVGQCSNRGLCDGGSGICQCFPGYSGDDCSTMNALAQ